jgi:tRNA A-37 threonylcarbamoyl transferase component Bud32
MPPLLKSLAELRAVGHYHGDARVENAIMCGDRIKWIDFLTAECGTPYVNVMRDVGGKCVH